MIIDAFFQIFTCYLLLILFLSIPASVLFLQMNFT